MSVMLFILVLAASFVIVRVGAIAFQLTGLEWSLAKFQALSCFTGTGFTTRESELIMGDKRRRKIATVLIVLGNGGFVTLIVTAVNSLNPQYTVLGWLSESYLPFLPMWSVRWFNLAILVLGLVAVYKLFTNRKFTGKFTRYLRQKVLKYEFFKPVSFEELLLMNEGYGITQVEIPAGHTLIGKTLLETELRQKDITVLSILRGDKTLPNPTAETQILKKDHLFLFGKLENIRTLIK